MVTERTDQDYRDKAATIWLGLTEAQKEDCRWGMYPTGVMIDCQGEGYSTLKLLRALQEHCPKDKAPDIVKINLEDPRNLHDTLKDILGD